MPNRCNLCGRVELFDGEHEPLAPDRYLNYGPEERMRVCQRCICDRESLTRCRCCERRLRSGAAYVSEFGGETVCFDCYNASHVRCCECGRVERSDDTFLQDHEDYIYCMRCARLDYQKSFIGVSGETHERTLTLRKFGVELETHRVPGNVMAICRNHPFKMIYDGSIEGKEFVSRPLWGDRGLQAIEDFCDDMRGCEVSKACGFHLHLDASDLGPGQLWAVVMGYRLTQRRWFGLVPPSRRRNRYCRRMTLSPAEILECDRNGIGLGTFVGYRGSDYRYKWFNVMSFGKQRTLEVRLHSGTMDKRKIVNWIRAHLYFFEYLVALGDPVTVRENLGDSPTLRKLKQIWNDRDLADYFVERRRQFRTQPELAEV